MTVRFKFRSSVEFDSADLAGRASISVADLRAMIIAQKNLQICRDVDLVISDADTGQAFGEEEFQIQDGSSVIIKRVPAGLSLPLGLGIARDAGSSGGFVTMPPSSPSEDFDVENFDDFGIDFHPTLEASLSQSDEVGNGKTTIHKKNHTVPRSSGMSISKCQNFEWNDLNEAIPKGILETSKAESDNEGSKKKTKLKLKEEERTLLDEGVGMSAPATLNTDLPTELRCSLCNTIFKEAVLIPCCQHSFCDKCIRSALVERARCPKCSSLKCKVEDLLPNLSLRQAIEHFLDAQVAVNGTDNIIPYYVPDVESGIEAKEVSCAQSIRQQHLACPHSPSVTGKGSNQVMAESAYGNRRNAGIGSHLIRVDSNKSMMSSPSPLKKQLIGNENSSAEALKQMADFEAGGSSKFSQSLLRKEEASTTIQKRKVPSFDPSDGSGVSVPPFKHRKGDRTCYMCGSPNHLIRDCPAASNPYPVMQTGDAAFPGGMSAYGQAYWHGATIPHIRPYANIFGVQGMMPYDPAMLPVSPFGVPSYMPSLYAGMPAPYGFMRMGGVPSSVIAGAERPLTRAEFMDFQDGERKHRHLSEQPDREVDYDSISEYPYDGSRRRSHEQRHHVDRETTRSCSDRESQMINKKHPHERHYSPHRRPDFMSDKMYSVVPKQEKRSQLSVSGRDDGTYYSEKSNSEVQDLSDSSRQQSRERRRHHHKSCSKKHSEKTVLCSSDSSRKSHHQSRKEKSDGTEKIMKDQKRRSHKHHSLSESGFEPDYSSFQKKPHKKESSQSSTHSRQEVKSSDHQLEDDRWEMADGLGEDYRGDHYFRKRKRRN